MAHVAVDRVDDALGAGIERLVRSHHRRRLSRVGWARAFDAPAGGWAGGGPEPRAGNAIDLLVDGEDALPRVEEAIAAARSSVLLAGWTFTPSFRLSRGGPTLRELLADVAGHADVRVLTWAGAPLPLFHPSRREVREMRDALARGTNIRVGLDAMERPMHCHHEKLVVVDGVVAFVGGIDLTSLGGDRLDSSDHPAHRSIGWHDAALRIRGPLVPDVRDHFDLRWREVVGGEAPADAASDTVLQAGVEAQLVRTVPEHVYDALPRGDFRVFESYVRALRSAERLVYLESQFLWSTELVEILVAKLRDPPSEEFRIVVLLPARPNNGADDTRGQLGILVDADRHDRFLACTLYQPGEAHQVYVHAKLCVVDDRVLIVGSANLNEHSLFNDTEVCVVSHDEELARSARLRLWREHLERDDVDGDPARVVDELWRPIADENAERRRRRERVERRLARLPHVSRRTRRFVGPVQSLLVDG
jgi:phosphatidylserine/phosphatidylglycerophosphate/cardiolipin synthase-like enzyme